MWRLFSRKTRQIRSPESRKNSFRPCLEALEERDCPSGGALQWGEALPSSSLFSVQATAFQSDGKIVLAGRYYSGFASYIGVTRLNPNGTLDTTFNGTGTAEIRVSTWENLGESASAVAIEPNGQIVVGGYAQTPNSFNTEGVVVRFNADGSLDKKFGKKGYVLYNPSPGASVNSLAILPGGVILAGGYQEATNTAPADFLAFELTSSGTMNTAFGSSGVATIVVGSSNAGESLAVVPGTGQIVLAGNAYLNSVSYGCVVMLTAGGKLDTSFNGTGTLIATNNAVAQFNTVALQGSTASGYKMVLDGQVPGTSTRPWYTSLTRYSLTGALDTSFGGSGTGSISLGSDGYFAGLALAADGSLVVGGTQRSVASDGTAHYQLAVVHLSVDGIVDTSFGPNGTGYSYAQIGANTRTYSATDLAINPLSGDIVLGGYVADASQPPQILEGAVARFTHA